MTKIYYLSDHQINILTRWRNLFWVPMCYKYKGFNNGIHEIEIVADDEILNGVDKVIRE
jgi:hypothetical protein